MVCFLLLVLQAPLIALSQLIGAHGTDVPPKNFTGRRWDSNPGPCRQHGHRCKHAKPLRHLDLLYYQLFVFCYLFGIITTSSIIYYIIRWSFSRITIHLISLNSNHKLLPTTKTNYVYMSQKLRLYLNFCNAIPNWRHCILIYYYAIRIYKQSKTFEKRSKYFNIQGKHQLDVNV